MRHLSLLFIALFAIAGLIFSASAESTTDQTVLDAAATETASAVEVLSLFASDQAELDLMLIFSGQGESYNPTVNNNCYVQCLPVRDSCLASCGGGFFCDFQCNAALHDCIASCS